MTSATLVAPTDLRDFLKAQGWSLVEKALADRLYVLENSQFERRQLVFPMDITAPDFGDAVGSVFSKLADLMSVPQERLISRVMSVRDDVLRLRVFFEGNDTALPLSFATTVVGSTEKLLKAGACTVLLPAHIILA